MERMDAWEMDEHLGRTSERRRGRTEVEVARWFVYDSGTEDDPAAEEMPDVDGAFRRCLQTETLCPEPPQYMQRLRSTHRFRSSARSLPLRSSSFTTDAGCTVQTFIGPDDTEARTEELEGTDRTEKVEKVVAEDVLRLSH